MQSEIFQAFICYSFDDYSLQLMKTTNSKLEYCEKVYILVSPFKLNNWNKWTFAQYSNFSI